MCDDKRRRGAKDKVFGSRWFPPLLQFGQPLLRLRFITHSPTPPSSRSSPLRRAFPSPACPPRSPQTLALSSSRRLPSLSSSSRLPLPISPPFLGSGTRSSSCPRMASDGAARGRPPKLPAHEGLDPSNVLTYKRRRRGTGANAGHSAVTPGPDPVKVRIPPPNPSSPLPQLVVLCYDDDMGFTRASVSPASRCLQLLVDFVHMPPDFGSVLQRSPFHLATFALEARVSCNAATRLLGRAYVFLGAELSVSHGFCFSRFVIYSPAFSPVQNKMSAVVHATSSQQGGRQNLDRRWRSWRDTLEGVLQSTAGNQGSGGIQSCIRDALRYNGCQPTEHVSNPSSPSDST